MPHWPPLQAKNIPNDDDVDTNGEQVRMVQGYNAEFATVLEGQTHAHRPEEMPGWLLPIAKHYRLLIINGTLQFLTDHATGWGAPPVLFN